MRVISALVAVLIAAAFAFGQSTVALRAVASVPGGRSVVLSDVAELAGPEAEALRDVVVLPADRAQGARVELAHVRALVEQTKGANLGRLSLSGGSCIVRVVAPAPVESHAQLGTAQAAASRGEAVRERVAGALARSLGVDRSDLRLSFEDGVALLDMTVQGRTIVVQPAAMGERVPVTVRVYEQDALLAQGIVRVGVQVRRRVVVLQAPVARGGTVDPGQLNEQEQWLSPGVAPATREQVLGGIARGRLEPGRVVLARDVEPPVLVRRGDLVTVDCISGSVVVSATARAQEPGREGEVIQFQSLASKKSFAARVSGAGRAVLLAGEGGS